MVSPFAAMVIAVWLACVAIESAFLLWDSEFIGRLLRRTHEDRFALTNFPKMLSRHGIDPDAYLKGASATDLRTHLPRCEACIEKHQCETAIEAEHPLEGKIGFCPNARVIDEMTQQD